MKTLFTGIYSKFTALPANALYTALSGRLYFTEAPQDSTFPYCVFSMVSDVPDYYFGGEQFETYLVEFNIFDEDNSASDIGTLYENLKTLYDDCSITVVGYSNVIFEREHTNLFRDEENNVWQYNVQYYVMLEKS